MAVSSVRHGFLCNNSGLTILLHDVISVPGATSCDKVRYKASVLLLSCFTTCISHGLFVWYWFRYEMFCFIPTCQSSRGGNRENPA